jgi:hypothetical protein
MPGPVRAIASGTVPSVVAKAGQTCGLAQELTAGDAHPMKRTVSRVHGRSTSQL